MIWKFLTKNLAARWPVILPVVLYLGLSGLYLGVVPPGESPDEPSHLQCIEQVTRYNRIPLFDPEPSGIWWARARVISGLTCFHLPLYYFIAGYTQQIVQTLTGLPTHYEFPPNNPDWETGKSLAMFRHSSDPVFAEPLAVTVLRWESIALGLVTLIAAGRLAQRLLPDQKYVASVAMVLVAGWPQFVYMSRAINNDVLATALAAATLIALIEVGRPRRYIVASVLASLAVLSKITTVFVAAAVVASLGLEVAAASDRRRYGRAGLISLIILGATAALILLEPTLRDHFNRSQSTIGSISQASRTLDYWWQVIYSTLQSGWARLGWMNVFTPDGQTFSWWLVLAVSGAIGAFTALRTKQSRTVRWVLVFCLIWLASILVGYVRINLNRFQPQFRYAFAIVPVLAALSATGWLTVTRRLPRFQAWLPLALAGLLFIANVWIVMAVLVPTYARY